jgi:hypothetical protein
MNRVLGQGCFALPLGRRSEETGTRVLAETFAAVDAAMSHAQPSQQQTDEVAWLIGGIRVLQNCAHATPPSNHISAQAALCVLKARGVARDASLAMG